MLQLYLHDFSEHAAIGSPYGDVDEAGCFAYPYLDLYWSEPGRLPFLIRTGGHIAGFVLVNQWFVSGQPGDHCKVLADRPFTECMGDGDRWMGPILRFQKP